MFIVQIAALILNSTDNLVITKLFGAAAATPYSFCYKYFNIIQTFFIALITPLLSAYTAAYTKKDYNWIVGSLKKSGLLYLVFAVGTIAAAFIFKPFSVLWLKKELDFEYGIVFCTAFYLLLIMLNHVFFTFITGISRVKATTIVTIIGVMINIPLSVFFARNLELGTTGVILGSIVCALVGIWVGPLVTYREIKKLKLTRKEDN